MPPLALHEERLAEYRERAKIEMPAGMRLALECGLGHEREYVRYWKAVLDEVAGTAASGARTGRDEAPAGM